MAATTIYPMTEKFIDKCDPEDPEYQRDLIRPVEIKEDVKLMEQRKRVSIILKSKKFRKELEDVIRSQCHKLGLSDHSASLLSVNHISEHLLLAAIPRKTTSAIGVGVGTNGIIPINDLRDSLTKAYSQNERQIRCKVAAIHRLMDMFSWCNASSHYVTARLAKDSDNILIKPFGLFFHEVTASSLITLDLQGNVTHPGSTVLSADNCHWLLQSAIHGTRHDICSLILLRTPAALCVSGSGFLPLSSESIMLGDVGVFAPDVELNSLSDTKKLYNDIANVFDQTKKVLIIPNVGIFVGGITVEETWFLVQRVQAACEVQELICKLDLSELILPDTETINDLKHVWQLFSETSVAVNKSDNEIPQEYLHKYRVGLLEFDAMMRHLDNSGYRTGYLYQTTNVYKSTETGDTHVAKYPDVEIPPSSTSLVHSRVESRELRSLPQDSLSPSWFNTPNSYILDDTFNLDSSLIVADSMHSTTSSPEHHRGSRWISAKPQESASIIPHHPVTPGAHISIQRAPVYNASMSPSKSIVKDVDPKELKAKQKKVKDKYYFDTNTAGPQSTLLDGLTWDEARRARDEGLTKFLGKSPGYGDEPLITAASKGIIQRDHKHHALVLESVFKPLNPFEKVTDDDLEKYKEEVDRKAHPELYAVQDIVTSQSDPELISPTNIESECSLPHFPSIPQDTSLPNISTKEMDHGMTSDSDYPGESSMAAPASQRVVHGTLTSETSAADISHDDAAKEGKHGKEKKKKKSFKSIFGKKKKETK